MRKWIEQDNRRNCGQIAVAVVTGRSLKYIIKLIGHDHGTKTRELVVVLRKLGYDCPPRLKKLKIRPKLAIAKLSFPNTAKWHWVVIDGGKTYDGVHGNRKGRVKFPSSYKITSYLPIKKI